MEKVNASRSAESTPHIRILVVDDSSASRGYILGVLESLPNVKAAAVESGKEALRAIKQGAYSIILCDYEMPDMSGLQVLRFVRAQRNALELPVLMLTSREESDVKVRAFRAGANDYISKQAQPEELLARVRTQLELLEANRRLAETRARAAEGQRFEAVGHLAEALAHELNTPAQYIGDNLDFLSESFETLRRLLEELRGVDGPIDVAQLRSSMESADCDYLFTEVRRCIQASKQGITQVSQIVAVMRDFGQRGTQEPSPQDLNEIVRGALTVSHGQWHGSVELSLQLDPDLPKVQCVGSSIKQVVLRAILSAVQAMTPETGPRRGDERLEISTRQQPGGWVSIEIADNGRSLSPPLLDPALGTMLSDVAAQALAHARAVIVNEHGGMLELTSRAPNGTCMLIRLLATGASSAELAAGA